MAQAAGKILLENIPNLVRDSLVYTRFSPERVEHLYIHLRSVEDQQAARGMLAAKGLVGFVANGAILPRASGASDEPMATGAAVPFKSPPSMEVVLVLPNRGEVRGMGIKRGITLIVGGGFHGKSTLLTALELGIYDHVPGDGREFVCADPLGVKVRAEDGRSVSCVDLSPFINNLPFQKDTTQFSTADASGSTSQATNIDEAIELGASTLFVDEDTCATNFMIRDRKMQMLVAAEQEPITPFLSKVQSMSKDFGISSIIVIGGSGAYFDVADCVVMMDAYKPVDVTEKARQIVEDCKGVNDAETTLPFQAIASRIPLRRGVDENARVKVVTQEKIFFGDTEILLSGVEQLVDISQTKWIADCLLYLATTMDDNTCLKDVLMKLDAKLDVEAGGPDVCPGTSLDVICDRKLGWYARARRFEVAAALNRLRSMQFRPAASRSRPKDAW
jgi:predicted ABC-class ATPase